MVLAIVIQLFGRSLLAYRLEVQRYPAYIVGILRIGRIIATERKDYRRLVIDKFLGTSYNRLTYNETRGLLIAL
jgi:hypothetical protein